MLASPRILSHEKREDDKGSTPEVYTPTPIPFLDLSIKSLTI